MIDIYRCLIIIPAYNEENSITGVVDDLIENYPQYDYVIVNDGSSDHTEQVCLLNGYHFLNLPINLGIGGAVQMGYRYALENGYDVAVQVDGDGQHDLSYLEDLITPIIQKSANVVVGSRFVKKEGFQSTAMRRTGILFLSGLIHLLCGSKIKDVTSGFRAIDKRFIKIFSEDYPYDYPEPETIVSAKMHGCMIKEVPVIMHERTSGKSSISFWKSIYYMIKVSLAIIICRIGFGVRR